MQKMRFLRRVVLQEMPMLSVIENPIEKRIMSYKQVAYQNS